MFSIEKIEHKDFEEIRSALEFAIFRFNKLDHADFYSFALVWRDEAGVIASYITLVEEPEGVYITHGGILEKYRGQGLGVLCVRQYVEWCKEQGYKRVRLSTKNTNKPMIKVALDVGFLITVAGPFEGSIFLDMSICFGGDK